MPYGAPEGSFLYWVTRRSAASTGQVDARPIATISMMLLGFIIMTLPEITPLSGHAACREHASVGSGNSDAEHARRNLRPRLLRLDAGVPDHLAPLVQLDLDEVPELLGRAGKRLEADVAEFRVDVRIIDDLAQLLIELRHDGRRRMGRRDDPGPRIHVEAGDPGLVQCRQLRKQRAALQARHRECAQRPGSDMWKASREIGEHHRYATCEHVLDGRR